MSFLKFFLISLILFFVLPHFLLRKLTGRFSLCGISSQLEFNPAWETPRPSEEELSDLKRLFQQKFTYLDCGRQCFAFRSEDGKYVLKFFKLSLRRLPDGLMYLPLPNKLDQLREKTVAFKKSKLKRDFDSYVLAYNELREETGLIFVHLNKTDFLNQTVTMRKRRNIYIKPYEKISKISSFFVCPLFNLGNRALLS